MNRRFFLKGLGVIAAASVLPRRADAMDMGGDMPVSANAPADVKAHPSCVHCGMSREKFAHSRMLVTYADGEVGLCSVRCFSVEYAVALHRMMQEVEVADYGTRLLIPAETASWVIGGDIPGVMTRNAKWAFNAPADANAFMAAHGGETFGWETAVEAAYADLYLDTAMVRKRRQQRMKSMK